MKVMILGAGGMLGTDLLPVWKKEHKVLPLGHSECDISNRSETASLMERERPDMVLLLAAATDVDRCQLDREYAFRTNAMGTEVVAQQCGIFSVPLVYISTIAVFNGEKDAPYDEYDLPAPMNVYGLSKYHGETAVREFAPMHWIVRTGWLFGGGLRDMKFVAKILRRAQEDDEISVVRDCVGSPTYTADLASGLLQLVEGCPYGTYHLINSGVSASRYELGRMTLAAAGYSMDRIQPCLSSELDLPAPRPRMEAAVSIKLKMLPGGVQMPDWRDSLRGYVHLLSREMGIGS